MSLLKEFDKNNPILYILATSGYSAASTARQCA